MKRFFILFLCFVLVLVSASCTKKKLSYDQFISKYKRQSYEDFLSNPKPFLKDFETFKVFDVPTAEDLALLEKFELDVDSIYESDSSSMYYYEKEEVLFNQPVESNFSYIDFKDPNDLDFLSFFITFDTGSTDMDWDIARSLTKALLLMHKEGKNYKIDDESVTENDLLTLFNTNNKTSFSADFDDTHIYFYFSYNSGLIPDSSFVLIS